MHFSPYKIYNYFLSAILILCILLPGCKGKEQKEGDPNVPGAVAEGKKQWQPIEVKAAVDNPSPLIGDIITYTLSIEAIPEITPKIPEMGSQITGLRIVDIGAEGPKMVDRRRVWKRWYKLQPDFTGSYIIPPAKVIYQDANGRDTELTASKIFLDVKSAKKEGEEMGDIRDIKAIENIKNNLFYIYVLIVVGILIMIIIGVVLFIWYRKRHKQEKAYKLPPHEIAVNALDQLLDSDLLKNEDYREFYFKLSEILRSFIEAHFRIPAQECTTEELIPFIEKMNISRSQKDTLRLLVRWEDLVKFAKQLTDREKAKKDWDETRALIMQTSEHTADKGGGVQP